MTTHVPESKKRTRFPSALFLSVLACCMMLIPLLLSACGGPSDGKIHLTMWYWNRSIDDKLIAQVGQQFPNIVLNAEKISDYDNKVRTSMAGHSGVPDIMGINSNISIYYPDEDQFVDLNTVGANDIKSLYLPWKWSLGTSPKGRQIAIPMDTGPTALFYRSDIFEKAGLPTDPDAVANLFKDWDSYLQASAKISSATDGKSFLLDDIYTVFSMQLDASKEHYFTADGKYVGNSANIKQMWDQAVKAVKTQGAISKSTGFSSDWNQAANNGRIASFISAVWMKQILSEAAPDTTGKWRIARAPGGDGNYGGSFMAVTTASEHPKEAYEVIKWLQSPENQLRSYQTLQLFPSAIKSLDDPSLSQPEPFFGGQKTTPIFVEAAKNVPLFSTNPMDGVVDNELRSQLTEIQFNNKDPEKAWKDAQDAIQRDLLR
ncbi:extracellular solute-binding protein [Ktedonospora formicarum]|uniref:Sugar ABC transporter substrate-binding protein n=1 Tax=Ktedonospora formicarum TaxID=2778364 RepID=A0A8J3I0R1_9CHLR|nr:extracellular solute-binding protein [Ktedonospora formicarum]GHO42774.1 sugar ABC transporter substrate-binding protein [Ktedonospora formicarum]